MRTLRSYPKFRLACGTAIAASIAIGISARTITQQQHQSDNTANTVADDAAVSPQADMMNLPPGMQQRLAAAAQGEQPEFPPFEAVAKGMEKVLSTADGQASFYTLWANKDDGRLIAELPRNYEGRLLMLAPTVAGGNEEAGVMGGTIYGYWKRIGKSMVLIEPNFVVRSTGDQESRRSVSQLYTDRVLLDVPIVTMGPNGGPVIDLKHLFVDQHARFFGPNAGGYGPRVINANVKLATLESAKAFPENIEVSYQMPAANGRLVRLHYSIRDLPENPTYKPRLADSRVGYFNVYYNEMGKPSSKEPYTRYITRWQLEKADPNVRLSPPKQPIVWYIEHTTPIRYRRFVREGILSWNKAFEKCGIVNAIEVYQQDAETGAHMDKDPEDARYNFFRWNTSNQGYAIGPSRWDPRTGQIIDADVVWHEGLTKGIRSMLENLSGEIAVSNFTPETLAWLETRPQWDPRVRMALPTQREQMLSGRMSVTSAAAANQPADHDCNHHESGLCLHAMGDSYASQMLNGAHCKIGQYLSMNVGLFSAALDAGLVQAANDGDTVDMLDELPEEFLGGMIRYVTAHEVGHCLGLQHNFSASTIRSLRDINSDGTHDQPIVGSVMEYAGVNINFGDGDVQGPYATPVIGPYDMWAIEFGYGPEENRQAVLARVSEDELIFHNDMAMMGPDPRVMVWDLGADPMEFAESRMRLVRDLRSKLATDLVKDGESWKRARLRFNALLNTHMQSLVIASRWIGGSYVNRDFKADPGDRNPVENVPADKQRRALQFIIDNAFTDDAMGLTPELLHKLGVEYFPDNPGYMGAMQDPAYTAHDAMSGLQASAMTLVMNPTTLRRLYDNEFRTNGIETETPLTLAEVLSTITNAVWSELDVEPAQQYTAAHPMISSFRRNLQREHLERLIDLTMPHAASSPAYRTIATLSTLKLREINDRITKSLEADGRLDEYTRAHLIDAQARIEKALNAQYVIGN